MSTGLTSLRLTHRPALWRVCVLVQRRQLASRAALLSAVAPRPKGGGFPQTLGRVQIIPSWGKELGKCPLEGKQQRKPAVPAPGSPGLSVGGRE